MIDKKATCKLKLRRSDLAILIAIVVLGLTAALSYFFLDARIISRLCQGPNNWHNNDWVEAFKYLGKTWVPIWLLRGGYSHSICGGYSFGMLCEMALDTDTVYSRQWHWSSESNGVGPLPIGCMRRGSNRYLFRLARLTNRPAMGIAGVATI